jgi:hypothetical protein
MLEQILHGLVAKYAPHWSLSYCSLVRNKPGVVELRGALPSTMHFGSARLTLETGVIAFFDEDHRDGYDHEEARVTLTPVELANVCAALDAP